MDSKDFWDRCKRDRRFYFKHCLKIRALKDGYYKLVPFILNEEQEKILQTIENQEFEGKPVRIIILKARKMGCSTLIEALGHHYCQFHPHANAKVVAHLKESTKEVFQIAKRYQENLPSAVAAIAPGKAVGASISWKHGSRFSVETQGSTDAARGSTPSFVHISELALWWKRRRSTTDEDVLQAQMGSVDPKPGTYIIIESTANGASGAFYNRFWKAHRNEPGNMFEALFFGWQEHDRYRLEEQKGDEELHGQLVKAYEREDMEFFFDMGRQMGYNEMWTERAVEFGLKPCQVRWAQQVLQTKFDGDMTRFDTEYPLSAQIAFTSSGKSPFDQVIVSNRIDELKDNPPPMTVGSAASYDGFKLALFPGQDNWQVYKEVDPNHQYVATIDSAHGIDDGDFSCVQVLDVTDRCQVAEFYARVPPDVVAREAAAVATAYNFAIVVPEVDGPGLAVVRELLDMNGGDGYKNLYVRSQSGNWTQRFGFRTGAQGKRDAAIAALAKAIRDKSWDFYSLRLLSECQVFIESSTGKSEAMPGEHDDAVMAMAIALYLDSEISERMSSEIDITPKPKRERGAVYVQDLMTGDTPRTDPHLGSSEYW